jgi:hypothetical protein
LGHYDRTLDDLRAALEAAGVEFTNGKRPGVRMNLLERGHRVRLRNASERHAATLGVRPGEVATVIDGAFNPVIHPGDEFAFASPRERSQIGSRRATLKGREELSLSIRP